MSPILVLTESSVAETVPVVEPTTRGPLVRMVFLASITVSFLAASAAPTPLYGTYQHEWGFSDLTITVIFGVYALAFLGALLTLGRLSDHIGRRPILFAGIAGQLLALAIFIDAHSLLALLVARDRARSGCGYRHRCHRGRHARYRPSTRRGGQCHGTGSGHWQRRARSRRSPCNGCPRRHDWCTS